MKILFAVLLSFVFLSAGASARVVDVSRVSSASYPEDSFIIVSLNPNQDVSDSKVTVYLPDGFRARRNVDLSDGRASVHFSIPFSQEYVRIVFSSDEGRRIKYRLLS